MICLFIDTLSCFFFCDPARIPNLYWLPNRVLDKASEQYTDILYCQGFCGSDVLAARLEYLALLPVHSQLDVSMLSGILSKGEKFRDKQVTPWDRMCMLWTAKTKFFLILITAIGYWSVYIENLECTVEKISSKILLQKCESIIIPFIECI